MARNFAREKRCLKRSMKIMLTLCISFFVFTSCGIPSYFYMYEGSSGSSSSYYNFTDGDEDNSYELDFAIELGGDSNSSVISIEGPTLIYLYTIVPSGTSDSDIEEISDKFEDEFSSEYINNNTGRPIPSSPDEVMSITYDSNTYNMYRFELYNDSTYLNSQGPSYYGLTFNQTLNDSGDTEYDTIFEFSFEEADDSYFTIQLDQTEDTSGFNFAVTDNSTVTSEISLRDYNGELFQKNWDGTTSGYENLESGNDYKIIIYTAMNVSNGYGFTNIFWSTLHEVAEITSD